MLLDVFICFTQGDNDANLCKIVRCKWFSAGNMSIPSKQRSLHNMEFISYILKVIEIVELGMKSLLSKLVVHGLLHCCKKLLAMLSMEDDGLF